MRKEDLEAIKDMRNNVCPGCAWLSEKIHTEFFEDDGTTLRKDPERTMQPFCTDSGLHLHFMRRNLRDSVWCHESSLSHWKYPFCPHFFNG